jgi:hypothetical protein
MNEPISAYYTPTNIRKIIVGSLTDQTPTGKQGFSFNKRILSKAQSFSRSEIFSEMGGY